MQNILSTITTLCIALALGVIAVVMFLSFPKINRYLDNQARHDCAQDYQLEYTQTEQNTVVRKPIDDLYTKCLSEKGVQ